MLSTRCALAALLAASLWASLATAQTPAPAPPPLAIEEVVIEPAAPTATTLCRLRVKLKNAGSEPASMLRFKVTVAGHELPVYRNQMFLQPLAPGQVSELKLYNFWASETGRPAPADGKMAVEVTLTEAKWMKVGPDASGVETWEPLGPVPGLPLAKSVTVALKK
jgi:hypothetical protein